MPSLLVLVFKIVIKTKDQRKILIFFPDPQLSEKIQISQSITNIKTTAAHAVNNPQGDMLVVDRTPIAARLLANSLSINLTNNKIPQPLKDHNASKKADEKKAGKTGQGLTTRKL